MSFVQEVLSTAEYTAMETIEKTLPILSKQTDELRQDMELYLRFDATKFQARKTATFANRLETLLNTTKELGSLVEGVLSKSIEHVTVLDNVRRSLNWCSKICTMTNDIAQLKSCVSNVEKVQLTSKLLSTLGDNYVLELPVNTKALAFKAVLHHAKAIKSNSKVFGQHFVISSTNIPKGKKTVLTVTTQGEARDEALVALTNLQRLPEIDNFTDLIWNQCFRQIILFSTDVNVCTGGNHIICTITVTNGERDPYDVIFFRIIQFSEFLHASLNFTLKNGFNFLDYITKTISNKLVNFLISECLQVSIPLNERDLQEYSEVIKTVQDLEEKLNKLKILNTAALTEYVENVEIHYIKRMCENYNTIGLKIMKSSIQDIDENPKKSMIVSKHMNKLLNLIDSILLQARNSSNIRAVHLYSTLQCIVNNYALIVYQKNEQSLHFSAREIAIFYNNCKLLSNILTSNKGYEVEEHYKKIHPSSFTMFGLASYHSQKIAATALATFVQKQLDIIKNHLKESDNEAMYKALDQLTILHAQWKTVLNVSEAHRIYGILAKPIFDQIMAYVSNTNNVDNIAIVTDVFVTCIRKIFDENVDVSQYLSDWNLLLETVGDTCHVVGLNKLK